MRPTIPRIAFPLLLLGLPSCATLRPGSLPHVASCGAEEGFTLTGDFWDWSAAEDDGRPVRGAEVNAPELRCGRVFTDAEGRFELRHVPLGTWVLESRVNGVEALGVARVEDTWDGNNGMSIHTAVDDALNRCRADPACAPLLVPDAAATAAMTDDERFQEAVVRTALVLGGRGHRTVCTKQPQTAAVLAAARARFPRVETEGCVSDGIRELRHAPTQTPATDVGVSRSVLRGDVGIATVFWGTGGLSGAAFDCVFRRVDGQWTVRACHLYGIA